MTTKDRLRRLVDGLAESELEAAERALEMLADPLHRLLRDAPEDDEPLAGDEQDAIAEGLDAYRYGKGLSAEKAKRELLA